MLDLGVKNAHSGNAQDAEHISAAIRFDAVMGKSPKPNRNSFTIEGLNKCTSVALIFVALLILVTTA